MYDEFGLLKSVEHGLDDIQEIELEDILIEPEKEKAIVGDSELPIALG
jgi:hypothetical protein